MNSPLGKAFYAIACLSILLIASCKVGHNYIRPEVALTGNYRSADSLADTNNIANIRWQDFFTDSSLLRLIDSGLVNNYDMREAVKNIGIANQGLRQTKAAYYPEIDATLGGTNHQWRSADFYSTPSSKWYETHGKEPSDHLFMYQSQYMSSLNMSWELDIWGKLRRQQESAQADYLQTHEARKAIQTALVAAIADGYYNLLMLDAQIVVARRNLQLNDSTLRLVKLQRDAGEVSSLAIQQTESQMLIAASLIPQLEQEIAIQENSLMALTGRMPDSVYRSSALGEVLTNDSLSTGVPLNLLDNRPDVTAAELQLRSANAQVGVAQAYRYPNLTLSASAGLNAMLPENWFNIPGALFGGVLSNLTQPLFKGRKLKTQHEIAKLERDKAEINFQRTVLNAANEVSNALITVQKLKEQYRIGQQRTATSRLAVRNAGLLFKSGEATYLEVITAQSNALTSELDLVSVIQMQLKAKVELYRALGGGWK